MPKQINPFLRIQRRIAHANERRARAAERIAAAREAEAKAMTAGTKAQLEILATFKPLLPMFIALAKRDFANLGGADPRPRKPRKARTPAPTPGDAPTFQEPTIPV